MAKQSGIHQLKGKVGEMSYYQTTGISGGLVRRINQGLSERVKTDEAFANTRLNNAEFGQAGAIAAVLARFIVPKFRPMVLPFSQAKIAKYLLEAIKQSTGNWGERNVMDTYGEIFSEALNLTAKNPAEVFISDLSDGDEAGQVVVSLAPTFEQKINDIGATGADIKLVSAAPWIGTYSAANKRYGQSYARGLDYLSEVEGTYDDITFEDVEYRPAPPAGWPAYRAEFYIVIVLPYRTINGVKHTLQEHCTFKAFSTAQGA